MARHMVIINQLSRIAPKDADKDPAKVTPVRYEAGSIIDDLTPEEVERFTSGPRPAVREVGADVEPVPADVVGRIGNGGPQAQRTSDVLELDPDTFLPTGTLDPNLDGGTIVDRSGDGIPTEGLSLEEVREAAAGKYLAEKRGEDTTGLDDVSDAELAEGIARLQAVQAERAAKADPNLEKRAEGTPEVGNAGSDAGGNDGTGGESVDSTEAAKPETAAQRKAREKREAAAAAEGTPKF